MTSSFQNALVRETMFKFVVKDFTETYYKEVLELPELYANKLFLNLDDVFARFHNAFIDIMDSTLGLSPEGLYFFKQPNSDFLLSIDSLFNPDIPKGDYQTYFHYSELNSPVFEGEFTQETLEECGLYIRNHDLAKVGGPNSDITQIGKTYLDLSYSIYESAKIPANPDSNPDLDSIVNTWHHFHYRMLAVIDHADKIAQGTDG